MSRSWAPMYWADYHKHTRGLSMLEHAAYLLLLSEYYMREKPLHANASFLHRVCSAFASDEQAAVHSVLDRYFILDGDVYRHERCDEEIAKAKEISDIRSESARKRWNAKADANALQKDTQPQPHIQPQPHSQLHSNSPPTPPRFAKPSLEDVTAYCTERGNDVDPAEFIDHYTANGWRVGKTAMKDWKAAVRTWERQRKASNGSGTRAPPSQAGRLRRPRTDQEWIDMATHLGVYDRTLSYEHLWARMQAAHEAGRGRQQKAKGEAAEIIAGAAK